MKIDGDGLSKACSSDTVCNVYNNLCGSELNVVLDQLKETQNSNKNLLIACTQEQKTFDELAEENNFESPKTFNIRELAGWSKEGEKSTPKISSLIHSLKQYNQSTTAISFK